MSPGPLLDRRVKYCPVRDAVGGAGEAGIAR
jgi:hypothetical protein